MSLHQSQRDHVARQVQQWTSARNVPQAHVDQMVHSIATGQADGQILQAMAAAQTAGPAPQQHFVKQVPPPFNFQTPFGTFEIPAMEVPMPMQTQMPMQTTPSVFPPPPMVAPNMVPGAPIQQTTYAPNVQSKRTTFSGGEVIQQSSSYSGQQGNTAFQYSSSSSSTVFSPMAQPAIPPQPFMPIQNHQQQQALPATAMANPAQRYAPAPMQPQAQQPTELPRQPTYVPEPVPLHSDGPVEVSPSPEEPFFDPAVPLQAPQNPRLAETFQQQLDEATYFSDIPGMPDQGVRK